jgi:HEAT repeat protein
MARRDTAPSGSPRPSSPAAPSSPFLILPVLFLTALLAGCGDGGGDKDIVSYVSDLRRDDFLQRLAAAKELSLEAEEVDVVAVPYLIEALEEPREMIQRYSAQALGRIRAYTAIPALIKWSRQGGDYVRFDCVSALGKLDDPRVHPPLIEALKDESSYVRWAAAEGLGELGVVGAYPRLVTGLRDSSSYVRSASAKALGQIGDAAAIPHLKSSLYDRNLWVRNASARALARLGDQEGIPILIKNLESEAQERDELVRAQAAEFLREATGENFGFDPRGPAADREEAIRRWQDWWQNRR